MRVKLLLLFFVFSFLWRTDHSFNQDLGRHLKIGEIIWQTKSVPLTNLFSYTYPDFPFINSHWLFELLLYFTWGSWGAISVLILKITVILAAVFLTLKIIPKNQLLLLPIGFLFLHVLRERPDLRPEIFSFLFTSLILYILTRFEQTKSRLVFLLPAIQLFWVNIHIYFIVGIGLELIFLADILLRRRFRKFRILSIITLASAAASLVNPSGLKGFLNPFLYGTNYGYTIVENQTMFLLESINFRDPNFLFVKTAAVLIILSVIVALVKKRLSPKNLGLAGFGLALALMNVRSFPYLVFISLPAVLDNLGSPKAKWLNKSLIFVTVAMLLYESFFYLNGDYYKYNGADIKPQPELVESGKTAMDFVLAHDLPQPIFNNFDIGSYITYRGWPKYRIFVDARPGEYPKEFFQQVYIPMQADPQKFEEVAKQYNFQTIVFSHTDQTPWAKTFLTNIIKNPNWNTVYIDDFMIVLVKDLRGLPKIDLTNLKADSRGSDSYLWYLRLSLFLAQTGNLKPAEELAKKSLILFPQSPLANALFGVAVPNKFFW